MDDRVCSCHVSAYAVCDYEGGCGSRGGCCDQRAGTCVTCPVLRPDQPARDPHQPPVCDGDRNLIDKHLIEIGNDFADLTTPEQPIIDNRRYERFGVQYLKNNRRQVVSLGEVWADPVAPLGGVGPIPSKSGQPSVSGSRERPLPIRADVHDLKAPARHASPSEQARRYGSDQIGRASAAEILADICADVRDTLNPGHHLPPAQVNEMVAWLRPRMDDVCDRHPAIADIALELKQLRGALRSASGNTELRQEACEGIRCKRCEMTTLFRMPGGDVECVNPDCATVMRGDEYADWVKTLKKAQQIKRHAGASS